MIKNIIFKSTMVMMLFATLNSCLDYEDLRDNPNEPNSVPPSLIFTQIVPGPTTSFSGTYEKMQYHMWIATDNVFSPNFNDGYDGSFDYSTLRNIIQMEEEAEAAGAPAYIILGKFLKARIFVEMSRRMGDIPLSEAGQGIDIPQPKYDSQKSIYIQCLDWLNEANQELGAYILENPGVTIDGDPYYGGDLKQWQKFINAYALRVLISLSKKENEAGLNVKERFAAIINNPGNYPLLSGLSDNAQLEYSNEDGFRQTYNPDEAVRKEAVVLTSTYLDILINNEDPRLMKVADPTKDALEANPGNEVAVRADYNSYAGADISGSATENSSKKLDGDYSFPNDERFWNYVGQPGVLMSYWEQELHIAEAAHRGWVSVDASTHYDNGVTASMEFYGVDPAEINDYLTNKQPYLAGDAGLTRILEQKYLAFAENSDHESFFTTRRTGVPSYLFTQEHNSIDRYPVRWTYPESEDLNNKNNYRAALVAQFGSEVDDRDQVIWILQD